MKYKKSRLYLVLFLILSNLLMSQNDTISTKDIEEVKIINTKETKIKSKNGKYSIDVIGTQFQQQTNTWEALKTISFLKVEDNSGLSVFNKQLKLEINGILVQIPSTEIEEYIKNIDPQNIKNIEIATTPNSSYSSDVEAIINISLYYKVDDYRVGITSNTGVKSDFFTSEGINTTLGYKKIRGYFNYAYTFYQPLNTSDIKYTIQNEINNFNSRDKSKNNAHNIISNLEWNIDDKNKLVLMQDFSFKGNNSLLKVVKDIGEEKIIKLKNDKDLFKFSQIFTHSFNQKNKIKIGSQQVISNSIFNNFDITQTVETKIPLSSYFIDYTNINSIGETLMGFKIEHVNAMTHNFDILQNTTFHYNEAILSSYLNQTINISDSKNISTGLRYESTAINLHSGLDGGEVKRSFENLIYNVSFQSINPDTQKGSVLSFKKNIQRPNYSYLNKSVVNNDVIGFIGNEDIVPTKYYVIGYEYFNNKIVLSAQTSYVKDFLSTFYEINNDKIYNTYTNFDEAYISSLTMAYDYDLFKFWNLKTNIDFTHFKLNDDRYSDIIKNSTPILSFRFRNRFKITKNTFFNINYNFSSKYSDGLITHGQSNKLDLLLIKRFKNLDLTLYTYDLFKGMIEKEKTEGNTYFINSERYRDNRLLGLSLKWNIVSKKFKESEVHKIVDEKIDRL